MLCGVRFGQRNEGARVMRAGDVLIQRGTMQAWANRFGHREDGLCPGQHSLIRARAAPSATPANVGLTRHDGHELYQSA